VLVDTAGRLHTKGNLMAELAKMARVAGREVPGAPHETLLVLDATLGSNALNQGREFAKAGGVTGLVVTKLDGTAKGGVAGAVVRDLGVPIRYVGVGEAVEDLLPFDPSRTRTRPSGPDPCPLLKMPAGWRRRWPWPAAASARRTESRGRVRAREGRPRGRRRLASSSGRASRRSARLRAAGAAARGATALRDPRALRARGRTPPCAPAPIAAGGRRVAAPARSQSGRERPRPRRPAPRGLEVTLGVAAGEAIALNERFVIAAASRAVRDAEGGHDPRRKDPPAAGESK
jgi:hypothetical protein